MMFIFQNLPTIVPGHSSEIANQINQLNNYCVKNRKDIDWFSVFQKVKKEFPAAEIGSSYKQNFSSWTIGTSYRDFPCAVPERYEAMEYLTYIVCLLVLYPLGFNVILTKCRQGDGGFDVGVKNNNKYCLLIDLKGQVDGNSSINPNQNIIDQQTPDCVKLSLYGPQYRIAETPILKVNGTSKMQTDMFFYSLLNLRTKEMSEEETKAYNKNILSKFKQILGIKD